MLIEEEFADITPLIMDYDNNHWEHPFIDTYFQPDESNYDTNVYRIYLKNKNNEQLYICFKSNYLDEKVKTYFKDTPLEDTSNDIFKSPYINVDYIYEMVDLTLNEDVFILSPNVEFNISNSKDYATFRTMYPSEQFIFTDFGKLITEKFKNYEVNFFSLDCGMCKNDNGTYSWDS